MDKWTMVGLALLLAGVALMAVTLPLVGSEVVARESMSSDVEYLTFPEQDLEAGSYTVWIEDVYPGFDDWDNFDAYAWEEMGGESWGWYPATYRTANFDGVDCELVVGMDLPGGLWYFEIENYEAGRLDPPRDIQVFIVRSSPGYIGAVLGVGITLASLGALAVALLNWPRKEEKDD